MLLEGIETLLVLAKEGTMSKAGSRLYISQSAVSKRIANLEKRLGKKLIEPVGRKIKLTSDAMALIESVAPSLTEIQGALFDHQAIQDHSPILLACSETLVSAYLSKMMKRYLAQDPYINISTHQTPFIVERVQSGDASLGFCAGHLPPQHGLATKHIFNESFTIVSNTPLEKAPSALLTNDLKNPANTYQAGILQKAGIKPLMQMDSYTAAALLALGGVTPALVPESVVKTLNINSEHCHHFDFLDDLTRPVNLCYRPNSYKVDRIKQLIETIVDFVRSTA
ncbi:LysR family transcriptional regulator [Photobacterium lipolyticum]|uniref:LysR family transcriptional regulator n=1 Tax=Photobacterium lipolyticum TaxID=266810 RepID=A0A2T3N4C2_9GAMM|nr:LysR family transcriptional regulator [Photobacterium lipolyticum]PSW07258.1 LysR family transcriptional regulator [Photobacterium lipolyticum]